jgi:hypothetical protein
MVVYGEMGGEMEGIWPEKLNMKYNIVAVSFNSLCTVIRLPLPLEV